MIPVSKITVDRKFFLFILFYNNIAGAKVKVFLIIVKDFSNGYVLRGLSGKRACQICLQMQYQMLQT
jgi:hypothetical protein